MKDSSKKRRALLARSSHRRVIVAGYGPVGRVVADKLAKAGAQVVVIDLNPRTIERQKALGLTAFVGDASDPQVLLNAGIEQSDALIVAMPDEKIAMRTCKHARELSPSIFIAARANHVSGGMLCRQAGADEVIIEEVVTAEAMRQVVLDALLVGRTHHEPVDDAAGKRPKRPTASKRP